MKKMSVDKFLNVLGYSLAIALGVGAVALVITPIVKTISADGRVEYCYVEVPGSAVSVTSYQLWGYRPWRADRRIAVNMDTFEDAKAEADRLGCALK